MPKDHDASLPEEPDIMPAEKLLMWQLLRTFIWMDRALQENLALRGWPAVSRTESQVMLLLAEGIRRPIDISRQLGVTRQAINQCLTQLGDKGLVELVDVPQDRRCKVVTFASSGVEMREDAKEILAALEEELQKRIGKPTLRGLKGLAKGKLGPPPVIPEQNS